MRQYGLMPPTDMATMERTLEIVNETFPYSVIRTLEIGVHSGITSRAIRDFFIEKKRAHLHTGIDSQHDFKMPSPFPQCQFIIGSSIESFWLIRNLQHLVFIDGNHSYPYTIADFFCYKDLVEIGGYIAFHDCGKQIKPFKDYQGIGSRNDANMYISCRKAVEAIGLLDGSFKGWELVIDEYDMRYDTGGIVVVQKIAA